MNKKQFERYFIKYIEINLPENDKPALREAWNNTIDSLMRDGTLKKTACNWGHPKRFYTTSEQNMLYGKIITHTHNGVTYKDRVLPENDAFYQIVTGPRKGNLVHIFKILK